VRFSIIKVVFFKELRETLRDRRSLAVMFGIPLLLYPLVAIGISGIGVAKLKRAAEETRTVALLDAEGVPHLAKMIRENPKFKLAPDTSADEALAALKDRRIDAILNPPKDAERRALASEEVVISLDLDRSRTESAVIEQRLLKLLGDYEKWVIGERLRTRNVPDTVLRPVQAQTIDVATGGQRLGMMLALMLPNILLVTGMLGAFFPALNATTTEREAGTLETLLVTPAGRTELLVAKGILVLLSSFLTAGLNLVSMSLVLWKALSMIEAFKGVLDINATAMLLTYLAALPALIFFSAVVLVVGLLARNFREANAFATPVMLIPLASVAISMAEPAITPGILVTPVASTTVIIREVLTGHVTLGAYVLAFASSLLYAGIMVSLAARLFSTEQLVNPAWEPLSLKGLRKTAQIGRGPRRLPAIDEALILFVVCLLLLFYLGDVVGGPRLLPKVVATQILLVLGPALLFAFLGRYDWVRTFSLRRPGWPAIIGGVCLGIGLTPVVRYLGTFQDWFWPRDTESMRAHAEMFIRPLMEHPWLISAVVGVMAGVCEELLYRGPIFAALRRRLSIWPAIAASAVLFAAAHLDVHGLPIRTGLGMLLGYLVWRTGSILPAMIAHGLYDAAQLAYAAIMIRTYGSGAEGDIAVANLGSTVNLVQLGIGCLLTGAGLYLVTRRPIPATDPPADGLPVVPAADATPVAPAAGGAVPLH